MMTLLKKDKESLTSLEIHWIKDFGQEGNLLMEKTKGNDGERWLLALPKSMRKSVVGQAHDLIGHFAVGTTVAKTRKRS